MKNVVFFSLIFAFLVGCKPSIQNSKSNTQGGSRGLPIKDFKAQEVDAINGSLPSDYAFSEDELVLLESHYGADLESPIYTQDLSEGAK